VFSCSSDSLLEFDLFDLVLGVGSVEDRLLAVDLIAQQLMRQHALYGAHLVLSGDLVDEVGHLRVLHARSQRSQRGVSGGQTGGIRVGGAAGDGGRLRAACSLRHGKRLRHLRDVSIDVHAQVDFDDVACLQQRLIRVLGLAEKIRRAFEAA